MIVLMAIMGLLVLRFPWVIRLQMRLLSLWVLSAIFALLGFVISMKSAVERLTWRHLQRRKARALQKRQQQLMMAGL
jgi:hypothetical protein